MILGHWALACPVLAKIEMIMNVERLIEALKCYDKSYEVWMEPDDSTSLGVKSVWGDANRKVVHIERE